MSDAGHHLLEVARDAGISLLTGVPCSRLGGVIEAAEQSGLLDVPATNEGEALAIAAGAWLGGGLGLVASQNSGLGNMVNPLATLLSVFRIPAVLLISIRGDVDGPADEPQHAVMGRTTTQLLSVLGVDHEDLPSVGPGRDSAILRAVTQAKDQRKPVALLLRSRDSLPGSGVRRSHLSRAGDLEGETSAFRGETAPWIRGRQAHEPLLTLQMALRRIRSALPRDALLIATTGYTGRELHALGDDDRHFYMVGSMGCASGLGLGLALSQTTKRVVVLDGDGAALMRLGTFASIGAHRPPKLLHVLLDNGRYASTGGQPTVSWSVDFPQLAAACGYPWVTQVSTGPELEAAVNEQPGPGPRFIHVNLVDAEARAAPRPSCRPVEVATRFRERCAHGEPR